VLEKLYVKINGVIVKSISTCLSILKVLVKSKFNVTFPEKQQESCIVLGNGPSLTASLQKHPDFLKKHTLLCVNNFSISDQYELLKPTYYVMLDPAFWDEENELIKKTMSAIAQKTDWPLTLLVAMEAKKSALINQLKTVNPNIRIQYYNYTVFTGFESISFWFYKHQLAMPQSQNVIVAALFLALNLNFKKIILLGADHSWHEQLHVNDENVLCIKDQHFYDNLATITYKPFISYRKGETWSIHEVFLFWSKAFYGYQILKKYAVYCNAVIYNASERSFIDAFERIKIKT
jgi:hypothetical protein